MSIIVGLTSPTGVFIGASGDNIGQAIGELAKSFGDEIAAMVLEAETEIAGTVQGYSPRDAAAAVPDVSVPRLDSGNGGTAAAIDQADTADAPAHDEQGSDGAGGSDVSEGPEPFCEVCQVTVPPALAELAVDRFGAVRCRACGTW